MNEQTPIPRLINWTGYLAIALLLILPLSVLSVRSGAWQQGLGLYALACLGATALLALFVLLLMLPRFREFRPQLRQRALYTLPGTALLSLLILGGGESPPIHDISTDTADPPLFSEAAIKGRGAGSNPLELDPKVISQQQEAWPELSTQLSNLPLEEAFELSQATAEALGWEIHSSDINLGIIEAVDTTAIMNFADDIVIRLRTNADGTLIDLRSVSRVGVSDMGANAARILDFQRDFHGAENGAP